MYNTRVKNMLFSLVVLAGGSKEKTKVAEYGVDTVDREKT